MSLLIESIKIFNGRIYNLRRHENRIQRSRVALISKDVTPISLRSHIEIPSDLRQGLVKCRIVYTNSCCFYKLKAGGICWISYVITVH